MNTAGCFCISLSKPVGCTIHVAKSSTINYNDIEKVTSLYEQLLAEKERTILILLKKLGK
jgi:hypothetical protein